MSLALLSAGEATPFRRRERRPMLYTPSRVFVARPAPAEARRACSSSSNKARSARQLTPSSSAGPTVHALSVGQLFKSGFTELCNVIMHTNETPLAAATHKLNQLKDKAGLSDAPADDSGRPRGRICG